MGVYRAFPCPSPVFEVSKWGLFGTDLILQPDGIFGSVPVHLFPVDAKYAEYLDIMPTFSSALRHSASERITRLSPLHNPPIDRA